MRNLVIATVVLVAGCGPQQPKQEASNPPAVSFEGARLTKAAAKRAHGERLTRVLGCRGCHTPSLEGQQFYELYASNLTREVPKYTDQQLDHLIRSGTHPSGREVWGMPSEIFQYLGDADYAALSAYLRTLRAAGPPTGMPLPFEEQTKKLIAAGELMPAEAMVRKYRNLRPPDLGPSHALGRYITEVTCAECHGPKLEGHPGDTPDLVTAAAYNRAEFETLITKGIPSGGRKLKNELMGEVARNRFSHLTQNERDALYSYLKARAEQTR